MPAAASHTFHSKKRGNHLGDFTTDAKVIVMSALALGIGVVSAFVAFALLWLINGITNLAFLGRLSGAAVDPRQGHLGYWLLIIPPLGGLIVGLMARFGSEKIRGHGIPEALEAILIGQSRIEPKVALLKPISSAISIGTGGPFGAEGPIIMTGGAFGSLLAQYFHLSSSERRTLLVAGAAGGMAAVFATPIAAVLLAVELLLFEWKPRSFIPVACASIAAAAVRIPLLGPGPIFLIPPHAHLPVTAWAWALAVGLLAGFGSGALTSLVYLSEDLFLKLPIHWMWWPVLGGFAIGVGGLIDPRVLGVGYDTIHQLLQGQILGGALLGLLLAKALVWSISLGSGTSGGVLAPLLMMGGALGAALAPVIGVGDAGLWALVGMAAMMGGTMGSPFTAIVFSIELTRDVNALPALLVACVASHAVTVLLLKRSILTEKVARHGLHLVREYQVDPLELLLVDRIMKTNYTSIPSTILLSDIPASSLPAMVLDDDGSLVGVLTPGDLLRGLAELSKTAVAIQAAATNLVFTFGDETVREAVVKMLRADVGFLPVVDRQEPTKVVGAVNRGSLLAARVDLYREEHEREGAIRLPGFVRSA